MAGKEFHCCFKQYQLICLGKDEKSRHENRGWFSWGWIFKRLTVVEGRVCWSNPHLTSIPQDGKVILANLNTVIKLLYQKHKVN